MAKEILLVDDDDRYSRLRLISWWDQDKLSRAKIMVVGAGALGNEVLKNLTLVGVGRIIVVDFDDIESSNLTRSVLFRSQHRGRLKAEVAAEVLPELNPDTHITPLVADVMTDVGLGLFRDVDVVIGCLDNREARLWVNRCCWKVNTPWIDGAIQEVNGVAKVFRPPDGACYECAMTENDYRLINIRYSCPLLRQEDLAAGKIPTAPTISSIIGGLQVQEALKLIHGAPTADGQALVFNGVANHFYTTRFQRREDCLSHDTYGDAIEVPISAKRDAAARLFDVVREQRPETPPLRLELDRDLVVSLQCDRCQDVRTVMKPQQQVGMAEAPCPRCGEPARPRIEHAVPAGSDRAAEKLAALGVPPYDIVRVVTSEGEQPVLLAADRDGVME